LHAEPEELPDPATLSFDDDFARYLGAQVPAGLKRAAMAKLFAEPCFNQMDGLDVYIEDYNLVPNLPAEELDLLTHAKEVLNPAAMAASEAPQAGAPSPATESQAPIAATQLPAEPTTVPRTGPPMDIPAEQAEGNAAPPANIASRA